MNHWAGKSFFRSQEARGQGRAHGEGIVRLRVGENRAVHFQGLHRLRGGRGVSELKHPQFSGASGGKGLFQHILKQTLRLSFQDHAGDRSFGLQDLRNPKPNPTVSSFIANLGRVSLLGIWGGNLSSKRNSRKHPGTLPPPAAQFRFLDGRNFGAHGGWGGGCSQPPIVHLPAGIALAQD